MKSVHGFETTPERTELMRAIRGANTKPEVALRKALWAHGIRYRINVPNLPGKPDIVITKYKVIIFVDGEFWHGYRWKEKKLRIKSNREYWVKKIEGNIARDRRNQKELTKRGFVVLRFWENQIKKNIETCLETVLSHLPRHRK